MDPLMSISQSMSVDPMVFLNDKEVKNMIEKENPIAALTEKEVKKIIEKPIVKAQVSWKLNI